MTKLNFDKGFERTYLMHHIDWELVPESAKCDILVVLGLHNRHFNQISIINDKGNLIKIALYLCIQ